MSMKMTHLLQKRGNLVETSQNAGNAGIHRLTKQNHQ